MLRLVIDNREPELYEIMKPYANEELEILFEVLDIGDIQISTKEDEGYKIRLVLERKTASDLGASQTDGRYREQRLRLLALRGEGIKIGYIIEAPSWSPTLSRSWCLGKFNEVHLQTAIARLQLRYDIPVFHATSIKETGMWIRRFLNGLTQDKNIFNQNVPSNIEEAAKMYKDAIHIKKSANSTHEIVFTSMLQTIPGIGSNAANAIATYCGYSMSNLIEKTIDELSAINIGKRKLGVSLATKIFQIFHEKIDRPKLVENETN